MEPSYLVFLERGFGERAVELRSSGRHGSLFKLEVNEVGFEKINAKGIEMNQAIMDAFIDSNLEMDQIDPQALAKAFETFDKRHNRQLAGARSKTGLRQWCTYHAQTMIRLCKLLKRMQDRSPFKSNSDIIRGMKAKLGGLDEPFALSSAHSCPASPSQSSLCSAPGSPSCRSSIPEYPMSEPSTPPREPSTPPRRHLEVPQLPPTTPKTKLSMVPDHLLDSLLASRPPTLVSEKLKVKNSKKKKKKKVNVAEKLNVKTSMKRPAAAAPAARQPIKRPAGVPEPEDKLVVMEQFVVDEPDEADPLGLRAVKVVFKVERNVSFYQVRCGKVVIGQATYGQFGGDEMAHAVANDMAALWSRGYSKRQVEAIRDEFRRNEVNN